MADVDIIVEDDRWAALDIEGIGLAAVKATLGRLTIATDGIEVAVLACDDTRIAKLNADFREKTTATNVLSWPAAERAAPQDGGTPEQPEADLMGAIELGDIAISYDTCAREAENANKPMADHVMHLMIHGTLHLLGYDHVRDQDATLMEGLEIEILENMGIDNPYESIEAD